MYYIEDNYARPYRYEIDGNFARIWECNGYNQQTKEFTYDNEPLNYDWCYFDECFIGVSPLSKITYYSGNEYLGNTLLLKKNDEYYHVGRGVNKFKSLYPIIKFCSPVGNNLVPYPFAIDDHNNYYLIIENVILTDVPEEHQLKEEEDDNNGNPYLYYYNIYRQRRHLPFEWMYIQKHNEEVVADEELYDPEDEYIGRFFFTHNPFPEKDYDRMTRNGTHDMYLQTYDGDMHVCLKEEYVNIQNQIGEDLKVLPFTTEVVIER